MGVFPLNENGWSPMKLFDAFKKLNPYAQIEQLKKAVGTLTNALRPFSGDMRKVAGNYVVPLYPYGNETLYEVSYYSDILTIVQNALKREVFRNGLEVVEAEKTDADVTTSEDVYAASEEDLADVRKWIQDVNMNHQSLEDVGKELEDDLNIMDDCWAFAGFEYSFGGSGEISDMMLSEVLRMDPRYMGLVMNSMDVPGHDDEGRTLSVCPVHRENLVVDGTRCPQCGKKTYLAYFVHKSGKKLVHYMRHEVFHASRYRPSKRLGFSPVMTVWAKVFSLYSMDDYIKELYEGKRPPKGMLVFNTNNYTSLKKSWEDMLARAKENPHLPAIMGIQNQGQNGPRKVAEFFDFMKTLDELQYTEARQEMRTQIGAVYGVLPIFQADVSTSGGLNQEGLQVTVTNRAVEAAQIGHNRFYAWCLKARQDMGVVVRHRPSEEQDENAKLDRQYKSLQNGKAAVELGLQCEYSQDTGEVVIKDGSLMKPASFSPFGAPTGLPEGGPGRDPDKLSGSPEMAAKSVLKARKPFADFAEIMKAEINGFLKEYKRKPTRKELEGLVKRIEDRMGQVFKDAVGSHFDETYLDGVRSVERDLGIKLAFQKSDELVLSALKSQPVLSSAFIGLTKTITNSIHRVINDAYLDPSGMSLQKLNARIQEVADVADYRAETIARTETQKVSSAARRASYRKADPNDEFLYEWIGPDDHRTTQTSKRIKARVGKGVRWDDLVKIVSEESARDFPEWHVDKEYPVSHYNSRHVFVRVQ